MAVHFDASSTSDVIDMGDPVALEINPNAPMAMSCWVTFNNFTGTQTFVSKGFNSPNTSYSFQSVTGTPPVLNWGSFDGANHFAVWNSTWSTGQWHHIYGDYTGAGGSPASTWRLYIDGVSVATHFDTTGPTAPGRNFAVGAVNTGASAFTQWFSGCLADVAVFNGPLTPTEITTLGNGTLRPNTSMSQTLLGYWKLDTNIGTQPDLSGFGNNGTSAGSTISTCGDSPPYAAAFLPPTFTQSPILQVRNRVLSY